MTEKALLAFAQSVIDETAEAEYKSADIPAEPLDDGVAVVVGKSFESIVLDKTKDVLLEVYAPWCGHCKKLAPIYVKLAKRFATIDSVVIAKMDGTENEHPLVEAKGYPTLLFYPGGDSKKAMIYEGERTLKVCRGQSLQSTRQWERDWSEEPASDGIAYCCVVRRE